MHGPFVLVPSLFEKEYGLLGYVNSSLTKLHKITLNIILRPNGLNANPVLDHNHAFAIVIRHLANQFLISHVFYVPVMDIKENFALVRVKISFEIDLL